MTKQETLKRVEEGMKKNDCLVAKEIMDNMENSDIRDVKQLRKITILLNKEWTF